MKIIKFCVICWLFPACTFIHFDDSVNLGNGFRYISDGKYSQIIKSTDKKYSGIGIIILPPRVVAYDYNKQFIIAKSISIDTTQQETFWIIDKNNNNQITELDSIEFYTLNKGKATGLKLLN